jgi:hypothetical protein
MITKEYSTKQFNQFRPMVEKAVWKYSKKYHLDFAEIEGQGYLIFCEALEKLDPSKASFSTYLFNELDRLDGYCRKEYRKSYKDIRRIKHEHIPGYGKNIYINRLRIDSPNFKDKRYDKDDYKEYNEVYSNKNSLKYQKISYNYDVFEKVLDKMDYEISLSDDAKDILQYILSREWEDVEKNWVPRLSYVKKVYMDKGWKNSRILKTWQEIRLWWQESNKDSFCMEV